jgi:hypothetical protein
MPGISLVHHDEWEPAIKWRAKYVNNMPTSAAADGPGTKLVYIAAIFKNV